MAKNTAEKNNKKTNTVRMYISNKCGNNRHKFYIYAKLILPNDDVFIEFTFYDFL